MSYRFDPKKVREFQFRFGTKEQLKILRNDAELYVDPREQQSSNPSYHVCHGLTLKYSRGQNYATDFFATQKGCGCIVCNLIRDFTKTVTPDSKVWAHDSEVTGVVKNSHTSDTEYVCHRNFQTSVDTLLDSFWNVPCFLRQWDRCSAFSW